MDVSNIDIIVHCKYRCVLTNKYPTIYSHLTKEFQCTLYVTTSDLCTCVFMMLAYAFFCSDFRVLNALIK